MKKDLLDKWSSEKASVIRVHLKQYLIQMLHLQQINLDFSQTLDNENLA